MMESGFPVELGEGYESSIGVCSELSSVSLFPDTFITSAWQGEDTPCFVGNKRGGPSREFPWDYKVLMHLNR